MSDVSCIKDCKIKIFKKHLMHKILRETLYVCHFMLNFGELEDHYLRV